MKAVILCAGKGKRLRPFSHSLPKHILPVGNIPVLQYLLEELAQTNQVSEVAMIVSQETQGPVQEYLTEVNKIFPFQFTFLDQHKPLGLAHACHMAEKFVDGDDFIMLLGDNIIPGGLKTILLEGRVSADATILVREVQDPRPYGVVEFDESGRVISMEEKPVKPKSNFVIVGVYQFKPIIFSAIKKIQPSPRGELEITDAIFHLVKENRTVHACPFSGEFLDIGNPVSYLNANRYVIDHFQSVSRIDPTSKIIASNVAPSVSIGRNTTIENSTLTNSIVMEGSIVRNSRLENSIIGRNCLIELGNMESASRIIVGDDCTIQNSA